MGSLVVCVDQGIPGLVGPTGPPGTSVADRVELAAASSSLLTVYLREARHEGMFCWGGSNLSDQVSHDPQKGVYVPPTGQTGSTGAWVRKFDGGLKPEWFDAVGDGDIANMAADTKGLQKAIDFSSYSGVPVTPGEATYIIDGYKGDHTAWAPTGLVTHGGLIVTPGARIWGVGQGKTILRNGADLFRSVLRIRSGTVSVRDLTVDGDVENHHPCALGVGEPNESPTAGSVRGEGIIFEGGGHVDHCELLNLEIKNIGHYGIGIQNVWVDGCLIENITFSNIGGDCIDGKAFSKASGFWKQNIYLHNIISLDGAGHQYPGKYPTSEGHDDQTVIDLCEGMHLHGCYITDLNTAGSSIAVTGVRFRPDQFVENGRTGSPGASASLIRVTSSMPLNTGSGALRDVCCIEASGGGGFHISDALTDGGFSGCRIISGPESSVLYGSIVDVTIRNVSGDGTSRAYGFEMGSGTRGVSAKNILVQNCEYGARLGCTECDIDIRVEDSKIIQLVSSDTVFDKNNVKMSFSRRNVVPSGGDIDPVTAPIAAVNQVGGKSPIAQIFGGEVDIIQDRRAYLNLVATADDNSWSGDDPVSGNRILGGIQVLGGDVSGFATGIKAGARVKAAGPAGSTTYWEFTTQSQTDTEIIGLQIGTDEVHAHLPIQFPQILKADLPVATADNRGYVVFMPDAVGGKYLVVSSGGSWRYMDGTAV